MSSLLMSFEQFFFFFFSEDRMHHQVKILVLVTIWLQLWEFSMDLVILPDLIIKDLANC